MAAIKDIARTGTLSYNGVEFGNLIRTEIVASPVLDDAGRMVKYVEYTLHVHGWIYASTIAGEDAAMEIIHDSLSAIGGRLQIADVGFDEGVDTALAGYSPDVLWGVSPEVLSWKTMGHTAAEVVWKCKFHVNRCASASQLLQLPFLMFNFKVNYTTDRDGLTTRTISGAAELPAIRTGNTVAFNIERAMDRIVAIVPDGFRRTLGQRDFNMAKNRVDFSFVDEQLPGECLPPGITDGRLTYSFGNTTPRTFMQWTASLQGSLTVAPGYPNSHAGRQFFNIMYSKMRSLKAASNRVKDGVVMVSRFGVGHELFTRTSHFNAQFVVFACLHEILGASGVWEKLPDGNYRTWANSMDSAGVWDKRGTSGLRYNAADDRLVDACVAFPTARIGNDTGKRIISSGSFQAELECADVTESRSWLKYDNQLEVHLYESAVVHQFAQSYATASGSDNFARHVVQSQGAPQCFVYMHGQAARLKFKPDVPVLVKFGGANVQQLVSIPNVPNTPAASNFDCPIWIAEWSILYLIDGLPQNTNQTYSKPTNPSREVC